MPPTDEPSGLSILREALNLLEFAGCTIAVGPMDGNTWRRYRFVSERGSEPPFFLEPDNPDAWREQFERVGFRVMATYTSAVTGDLTKEDPRLDTTLAKLQSEGVTIRSFDPENADTELKQLFRLSLDSFQANYLYSPIDEDEFLDQNRRALPFVVPDLVLMAERDSRLVGFLFAIPDILQRQRRDAIDTLIIKTVAVSPSMANHGLGGLLVGLVQRRARGLGFRRAIHALMHEQNVSRHISRRYAHTIRRYALYVRRFPRAMPGMNIATVLRERAIDSADRPALIEGAGWSRLLGLDRIAANIARQLRATRIQPGDRVLVFCPMSVALYAVLVGIWRCGATAVFLDPSTRRAQLERCCDAGIAKAFLAVPRAHALRVVSPIHPAHSGMSFSIGRWLPGARALRIDEGEHGDPTIEPANQDTPALITFTSGSTGQPKAAVRSHGFLLAQHRVLAHDLHLQAGQRDLAALPIFVLANLASAVTSIIPDADLRAPGEIAPARLPAADSVDPADAGCRLASLTRSTRSLTWRCHGHVLETFEEIYTGGAPVFPRLLRRLATSRPSGHGRRRSMDRPKQSQSRESRGTKCNLKICGRWKAAPACSSAILLPKSAFEFCPTAGVIYWSLHCKYFDRDALPAISTGEIVVAGEHVLTGYLDGLGDHETKFKVGDRTWHRTGDAGYLDSSAGSGCLAARRPSSRRAWVIYPFAVECAAMAAEAVHRCALVEHGASVSWSSNSSPVCLKSREHRLQRQLAWARVTEVLVVDAIPVDKRHNAKVDYPALRALLERGSGPSAAQHFFVGVFVERNDPLGAIARTDHFGGRATHRGAATGILNQTPTRAGPSCPPHRLGRQIQ